MTCLLPLVLGCLLAPPQDEKPAPLRYLRPAGDKYVLESEITVTPEKNGSIYTSTTNRTGKDGDEKMTLVLHLDANNHIRSAEAVYVTSKDKKTATLTLRDKSAILKRGGTTDLLNRVPETPIVTTAPDWSDVLQLVTRYDVKKGGKQEFGGIWFHPVEPPLMLTFTVERVGDDSVKLKEQDFTLHRHEVNLRSGGYRVWSNDGGHVVRIVPHGGGVPVVLEGYEGATRDLK